MISLSLIRALAGRAVAGGLVAAALAAGSPGSMAAQIFVSDEALLNAAQEPNNWLTVGRDYAGTRFSPLKQVNIANVKRLVPVWAFQFGTLDAQQTTPLYNNGVLYATASHSNIFAIDARTGKQIWKYAHPLPEGIGKLLCCDLGNKGPALYNDKVYFATADAHVVALDAATGKVVWDTTVADYAKGYTFTVAPLAVKGKIVVGLSGAEFPTRLYIEALDAETGKQVWRRYTIPGPGEKGHDTWGKGEVGVENAKYGGGSAWITGSYDPQLDTLYWSTGNPNPDWDGFGREGDNLYTNSTLALNPDTGEIKFFYQYTPWDVWDFDGVNETILADLGDKKVWLHGDRNGFLYSIDRTNGKFVWAKEISKVNWATGFTAEGRPIIDQSKVPVYDKIVKDICPASEGGKWWNPAAYSPQTRTIFVPSREACTDIRAAKGERRDGKTNWGIGDIAWKQGYGQLVAFDASSGAKKWTVKAPAPFTSGLLATGGNLVFAGTPEGDFKAYDQDTGEELWSFQTGSGIVASPITFALDGKQYIAIASGWGGWTGWAVWGGGVAPHLKDNRKGGTLFVFALFDK
jgi:alcohol dehydrogenase (cytochrome c)